MIKVTITPNDNFPDQYIEITESGPDIYVHLAEGSVARTITAVEGVNVDYDESDRIIGVEILR